MTNKSKNQMCKWCTMYEKFTMLHIPPPPKFCALHCKNAVSQTNLMVCVPHFMNEMTQIIYKIIMLIGQWLLLAIYHMDSSVIAYFTIWPNEHWIKI